MTDQTAITPYKSFQLVLQREDVRERFKEILDKRAPAFMSSLLTVVTSNDALLQCDYKTILTSAAKAAILNLPIEPSLGFAHIVPFKKDATFIIGYKGLIQLALRTSQYTAINADAVYEGEVVTIDRLTGEIKFSGFKESDIINGFFAYFRMRNGYEKYVYMTLQQIETHAKKYSKSYGYPGSAWTTHFNDMAKKTVLRQLLGKWGLLSIDMQDEDSTLPVVPAGDPRLETPSDALLVPDFANAIEGQATDVPEPEIFVGKMSLETAQNILSSDGKRYGDIPLETLSHMARAIRQKIEKGGYSPEELEDKQFRLDGINVILEAAVP